MSHMLFNVSAVSACFFIAFILILKDVSRSVLETRNAVKSLALVYVFFGLIALIIYSLRYAQTAWFVPFIILFAGLIVSIIIDWYTPESFRESLPLAGFIIVPVTGYLMFRF